MKDFYLTYEQRWFVIVAIAVFIFIIILTVCSSHTPTGEGDYQQAKNMCGTKGVAHFSYDYHAADETEQPDVTCK